MSWAYRILLEDHTAISLSRRPSQPVLDALIASFTQTTAKAVVASGAPRRDVREIGDSNVTEARRAARGVALVCPASSVVRTDNGRWRLKSVPGTAVVNGVRSQQAVMLDAQSGFLVGDDLLLTTVHDLDVSRVPTDLKVVFDFRLQDGAVPSTFSDQQVFGISAVEDFGDFFVQGSFDDWLLLRLDRGTGRSTSLAVAAAVPALGTTLWTVGHPLGFPMKVIRSGAITRAGADHFECTLFAVSGCSGSIVADEHAATVVGVLQDAPCSGPGCTTDVTSCTAFKGAVDRRPVWRWLSQPWQHIRRWKAPHFPRRPDRNGDGNDFATFDPAPVDDQPSEDQSLVASTSAK